ncbi:MAG: tetratricopeptide repeat protein [Gammaproteobacteria bacterium]|nr:tetratricopeptide repeat protein [Gammaproteobacteria bacterium]
MALTPFASANSGHAGSQVCAQCHQVEYDKWKKSHHDLAMQPANDETVLGDFNDAEFSHQGETSRFFREGKRFMVETDGSKGELQTYPVAYTFGITPLQQYLIEFPDGRLQPLGIAWDSRPAQKGGQRWYHLYPDEQMDYRNPLHWTGHNQTWNYQCAECHSTGLEKKYDLTTDSYQTAWQEVNVGCEACHGPASRHVTWAEAKARGEKLATPENYGLPVNLKDHDKASWTIDPETYTPRRSQSRTDHTELEVCARCHSRRGQISKTYRHGQSLSDSHRLALLEESLYYPDGQIKDEVFVYGSFSQSKMFSAGVTCSDCHEPHSQKLRADGDAVCSRCHSPEKYANTLHHHHPQTAKAVTCVGCHMPQSKFMVIDERADHSIRIPRPDLSSQLGTPNACNQCHQDQSAEWSAQTLNNWYGEKPRPRHFATALHAGRTNAPDSARKLLSLIGDTTQPAIARATAIDLLHEQAQPENLFTLKRQLADPDPLVRAAAVRYMDTTDLNTRVDALWLLLEDPSRIVRFEVARVLAPVSRGRLPPRFKKQLEPVIEEYIQSQLATAERPESHLNLGLLYVSQGLLQEADDAYRTALRLEPAFIPGYINYADLYRMKGMNEESVGMLQRGLKMAPQDADLHHALGLAQIRTGERAEALRNLQNAAELAAGNSRYSFVYAVALNSMNQRGEAIKVLNATMARHPADRDIMFTLIQFNMEAGEKAKAEQWAKRFRQLWPDDRRSQQNVVE